MKLYSNKVQNKLMIPVLDETIDNVNEQDHYNDNNHKGQQNEKTIIWRKYMRSV